MNIVRNDILDLDAFRAWMPEYKDAEFILEDGKYVCGWAIEKMSKSFYNVVNPDYIVDNYGADTLRMYEMFLGPLEQSKPWDTNGIDGVYKFLRRFWRLFYDRDGQADASPTRRPTEQELRTLHKTIKKVCGGHRELLVQHLRRGLHDLPQRAGRVQRSARVHRAADRAARPLRARTSPRNFGRRWDTPTSVCTADYPVYDEKHLAQSAFEYPVSINGKLRFKKEYATSLTPAQMQADVVTAARSAEMARRQNPEKGHRRAGQDHQYRHLIRTKTTRSMKRIATDLSTALLLMAGTSNGTRLRTGPRR